MMPQLPPPSRARGGENEAGKTVTTVMAGSGTQGASVVGTVDAARAALANVEQSGPLRPRCNCCLATSRTTIHWTATPADNKLPLEFERAAPWAARPNRDKSLLHLSCPLLRLAKQGE